VNSVVANVNKETEALRAFEVAKYAKLKAYEARIEALEAQLKVCMGTMAKVGNGGYVQVSTTSKVNAPQSPIFHEANSAREIDNFILRFEAILGQYELRRNGGCIR